MHDLKTVLINKIMKSDITFAAQATVNLMLKYCHLSRFVAVIDAAV